MRNTHEQRGTQRAVVEGASHQYTTLHVCCRAQLHPTLDDVHAPAPGGWWRKQKEMYYTSPCGSVSQMAGLIYLVASPSVRVIVIIKMY